MLLTSITLALGTLVTLALAWLAAEAFRGALRLRRGAPPTSPEAQRWARTVRGFAFLGFPAFLLLASAL